MMKKVCSKCKIEKEASGFKKNRSKKHGLESQCKSCAKKHNQKPEIKEKINAYQREKNKRPEVIAYNKKYRKSYRTTENGKERISDYFMKKLYGISIEKYNEIFLLQNGNCKICKENQSSLKKKLAVDHCHLTKKIRGLLCHHCNTSLGGFKDDVDLLQSAIKYLKGEN